MYRNSEMDAYGVRGFGSVMSASKLAVATLASHAFELTTTSLVQNLSLFRIKNEKDPLVGSFFVLSE